MIFAALLALVAGALALAWASRRPAAPVRAAGAALALVLLAGAASGVAASAYGTSEGAGDHEPPVSQGTAVPMVSPLPSAAGASPPDPPAASPAPDSAITVMTGDTSTGVTVREAGVPTASEPAIERQLGVIPLVADECAVIYVHDGVSAPNATELDQACAFVRARLQLAAPAGPVPVFIRNASEATTGEVPMAGAIVIAVNADAVADYDSAVRILSHELTHALGGVDRSADGVCLEEGVATFVEASSVGALDGVTAQARDAAREGVLDDPRALRTDTQFRAGSITDIVRHYQICGAFVRYLVDRLGGRALLDLYAGRAPSSTDPYSLAPQFLSEIGGHP